jgi:hypothetical protein
MTVSAWQTVKDCFMTNEMPISHRLISRRLMSRRFFYLRRLAELAPAVVLLLGFAGIVRAQSQQAGQGYPHGQGQWGQMQPDPSYPGQSGDPAMEAKRLNALNAERQKNMVADANKLVKLAAELNEEVNGRSEGQLTADQLRKVAEIEKLAHSIREKMTTSVKPAPSMMDSPALIPNLH